MSAERFFTPKILPVTEARRIRQFSTPSWDQVSGMVDIRTHNAKRLHSLYENNLDRLREYYDTVYLAYLDGEKIKKPDTEDPQNKIFSTHYRIIRETVTRTIEKPSRGWAKHVRKEKATVKRT